MSMSNLSVSTNYARLQSFWTARERMRGITQEQTFDGALIGALSGLPGITDEDWKRVLEIARNEVRRVEPLLNVKL